MNLLQHPTELAPLYAVGALEGKELDAFLVHYDNCGTCTAEVSQYLVALSALESDEEVSQTVWTRIVNEIDGPADEKPASNVTFLKPRSRSTSMWFMAVAAIMVFALGTVTLLQRSTINKLRGDEAVVEAAAITAGLPGSYVGQFTVDGTEVAQVILATDGTGYLLPDSLTPLSADLTYQLWVITPDEQVISGGVLGNDPGPSVFTWEGDVAGFALTTEIAGGVPVSEGELVSVATEA